LQPQRLSGEIWTEKHRQGWANLPVSALVPAIVGRRIVIIDLIIRTYARQPQARQTFLIVGRQRFFARFGAKTLDFLVSVSHTVWAR
jgi:hypothetical protein